MRNFTRPLAMAAISALSTLMVAEIAVAQVPGSREGARAPPPAVTPLPEPIESEPAAAIPTFAEFLDSTLKLPNGKYIVDGDLPILGEADLYAWYEQNIARTVSVKDLTTRPVGAGPTTNLAIKTTSSGADAKWNSTQKRSLTYCVSTQFQNYGNNGFGGSDYTSIRDAVQRAADAWEGIANVDFIYQSGEDAHCTSSSPVLFRVVPYVPLGVNDTLVAAAFFPDTPASNRTLDVNVNYIPDPGYGHSLSGVMMHELGHVLGFVHEHIRPEAGGVCPEGSGWRPLTDFDRSSVMYYRGQCNGIVADFFLSALDKTGVQLIYGAPAAPPPPNRAPIAMVGMPVYSGYVGRPLRFDGSGSYDPEGHALVYTWSFGDGTPNSQTATNYVDHTYTTRGTYSVTLTVNDGSQNSTASATSAKIIDIRWIPALLELLIQ